MPGLDAFLNAFEKRLASGIGDLPLPDDGVFRNTHVDFEKSGANKIVIRGACSSCTEFEALLRPCLPWPGFFFTVRILKGFRGAALDILRHFSECFPAPEERTVAQELSRFLTERKRRKEEREFAWAERYREDISTIRESMLRDGITRMIFSLSPGMTNLEIAGEACGYSFLSTVRPSFRERPFTVTTILEMPSETRKNVTEIIMEELGKPYAPAPSPAPSM